MLERWAEGLVLSNGLDYGGFMIKSLQTVAEVFDALGGVTGVARLTGTKYTRVHNWQAFGHFPANSYRAIKVALAAKRLDASEELWPEMLVPQLDNSNGSKRAGVLMRRRNDRRRMA